MSALRGLTPDAARRRLSERRDARLREAQLPVAVSVLAAYVRAGRSLRQAVADAAGDVP
jgi:Flp pilus assembly protein TadB